MCNVSELNSDSDFFKRILQICPPKKFEHEFTIINEGQVPFIALLLCSGRVTLKDKNGVTPVEVNRIIGLRELFLGEPLDTTVTIEPSSSVCLIDKATLKELIGDNQELLEQLIGPTTMLH